jgi:hypothetical protein
LLTRLYVPLATLALTLGLGNALAVHVPREAVTTVEERARVVEACLDRRATPEWIFLGNSQTSSIRDARPGDIAAPGVLEALVRRSGSPIDVCSISLGGMNLAETFAILAIAGEHRPAQIRGVLTSVGLDQMRGLWLREEVAWELGRPEIRDRVRAFVAAQTDLPAAQHALEPSLQAPALAVAAESVTPRARLVQRAEARLQNAADYLPVFALRVDLLRAVANAYVTLRNRLLHISSATNRAVPATSYAGSMQLFEMALRYARHRSLLLVTYVSPLRHRLPRPFPEATLARIRRDTRELCARYGATCLDYMDLLPESAYSVYPPNYEGLGGQPDFVHLTAPGHFALAARLSADLAPLLRAGRP